MEVKLLLADGPKENNNYSNNSEVSKEKNEEKKTENSKENIEKQPVQRMSA